MTMKKTLKIGDRIIATSAIDKENEPGTIFTIVGQSKHFYIGRHKNGYVECFLKKDYLHNRGIRKIGK